MRIEFKNIKFDVDGILTCDVIRNVEGIQELKIKLPESIDLKADLIALAFATLAGTKYDEVIIDLPLGKSCQLIIEEFCNANLVCDDGDEIERALGDSYALSFSGGFDSLAARALLPKTTKLISLDFGGAFSRERLFFEKFNPYIIETNLVELGLNRNHWGFMAIGVILLKDYLSINVASFGSILASSIPAVLQGKDISTSLSLLKYLNIITLNPLAGVTEIGAMSIALDANKSLIMDSLHSLANPKEGKFFRKTLALQAYLIDKKHDYTLPTPKARGWYTWGKSYADDLSAIYIYQRLGAGVIEGSYSNPIPSDVLENIEKNKFTFYFKYNQLAYSGVQPELQKYILEQLQHLGFTPYDRKDFDDIILADYLIRSDKTAGSKINNLLINRSLASNIFMSVDEFCANGLSSGRYQIDLDGSILNLELNIDNLLETNTLIASFNGPTHARSGVYFDNVDWLEKNKFVYIAFSDPVVDNHADVLMGWYLGDNEQASLPKKIASLLDLIAQQLNLSLVLIGGASGGFAALNIQKLLTTDVSRNISFTWNPHTNLSLCYKKFLGSYSQFSGLATSMLQELGELYLTQDTQAHVVVNGYDSTNIRNHIAPFFDKQDLSNQTANSLIFGTSSVFFGDWGAGHVTPPREFLINALQSLISGGDYPLYLKPSCSKSILNLKKHILDFDALLFLRKIENKYYIRCTLGDSYIAYCIKINIRVDDKFVKSTGYFLGAYQDECIIALDIDGSDNIVFEVIVQDYFQNEKIHQLYSCNAIGLHLFKV